MKHIFARWKRPVPVYYYKHPACPIDHDLVMRNLSYVCNLFRFYSEDRLEIYFAGIVTKEPEEEVSDCVVVTYRDEGYIDNISGGKYWAWTSWRWKSGWIGKEMTSAVISFDPGRVRHPSKLLSMLMHEITHAIGVDHYQDYSIMRNDPYLTYPEQGTYKLADFQTFQRLVGGSGLRAYPTFYDWGMPAGIDQYLSAQMHIPIIKAWGKWWRVDLNVFSEKGKIILETQDYYPCTSYMKPAAELRGDLLEFDAYYDKPIHVTAEKIKKHPSDSHAFRVVDIQESR